MPKPRHEDDRNLLPLKGMSRSPIRGEFHVGENLAIIRPYGLRVLETGSRMNGYRITEPTIFSSGIFADLRRIPVSKKRNYFIRVSGEYTVYPEDKTILLDPESRLLVSLERKCVHPVSKYCSQECYHFLSVLYGDGALLVYNIEESRRMREGSRKGRITFQELTKPWGDPRNRPWTVKKATAASRRPRK